MATVEIRNVTKRFGTATVLAQADLAIADGEFMVLVGPSGCGKSTLLRLLAGLEEVDEGDVLIGGERVNDLSPAKRGIAMVFQSYALYPHMSVRQNMAFGLRLAGKQRAEIDETVNRAAKLLDIEHLLERRPKMLSGGQRQRVAIGRAIVREPNVFLFDEPLSNLDAELRVRMRYEFAKLHKRLGTTTVYQVEAMTLADRIAIMDRGHIVQIGTPQELYDHPVSLFVAGFIGSPRMNFMAGTVATASSGRVEVVLRDGARVEIAAAEHGLKAGDAVTVGARPEHLKLSGAGVAAEVTLVESLGNIRFAYLASATSDEPLIVQLLPSDRVSAGEQVHVGAGPGDYHLFDGEGRALRTERAVQGPLAA
jgi:multiple sugar transport system ATP-binding protein